MTGGRLIAADDDSTVRSLVERFTSEAGYEVELAQDGDDLLGMVSEETDLILLDLRMPKKDGFECLEVLGKKYPQIPAIVLSGADGAGEAVKAMKLGAVDYLTKPFDRDELLAVLANARRLGRTIKENEGLKETIGGSGPKVVLIAESEGMKDMIAKARKVAKLESTILLTGESGVGKGMLARMIHEEGNEKGSRPFVTVSCPAIPRELLESELFGHERGAFTGAIKRRIGKLEAASGGTLFLDEVGELPLELQSKLLNVLQDREFQRVGGNEMIPMKLRLIAATNIDFEQKVAEGTFREDLYYRLSVIPLEIPPLRMRKDGLKALVTALLKKVAVRQGQAGANALSVAPDAFAVLEKYDWPGNVRQLENELERAAAFCEGGVIELSDLSKNLSAPNEVEVAGIGGLPLAEVEKLALVQTLKLCGGNKAEAARRLEISEKSIYNKLKKFGLSL